MVFLIQRWRGVGLWALALFTIWTLAGDRFGRHCAVVLDAREVRSLCGGGYPEADFWERAHIMGAWGALLHPESLEDLVSTGKVLRYSREEIAKLRVTQVAATAAPPLEPDAVWVRDTETLGRLRGAAEARGVKLSVLQYRDQHIVTPPPKVEHRRFSVGPDPFLVSLIEKKGLRPVHLVRSVPEILLSGGENAVTLMGPGLEGQRMSRAVRILKDSHWWAFSNARGFSSMTIGWMKPNVRAGFLREVAVPTRRLVGAGEASVMGGPASFIRESSGKGNALVIARLDLEQGVEENLRALQKLLKRLRAEGLAPMPGSEAGSSRALFRYEWLVRFWVGLLLTIAMPIVSLRWGIDILIRQHCSGRLPEASPFREACMAAGTVAVVGVFLGAAVYAVMSVGAWRLDATSLRWGPWVPAATFILSWLALYDPDPKALFGFFRRPLGRMSELRVALPVAAATFLLFSPDWLDLWGPQAWFDGLQVSGTSLWWVGLRWKEFFVGYPCLFVGFCVFFDRLESVRQKGPVRCDPRGWLLLGMFAPVGLAEFMAQARIPFMSLAAQALYGGIGGILLGVPLLFGRDFVDRRWKSLIYK